MFHIIQTKCFLYLMNISNIHFFAFLDRNENVMVVANHSALNKIHTYTIGV